MQYVHFAQFPQLEDGPGAQGRGGEEGLDDGAAHHICITSIFLFHVSVQQ